MKANNLKKTNLLPFIVFLMFLFQCKTLAQNVGYTKKTRLSMEITATRKVKEFKDIKMLGEASINFSEIKMNNKNEIIAIKIKLDDKKGNKITYQVEGLKPIKPIAPYVEKDQKGTLKIGFENFENKKKKK